MAIMDDRINKLKAKAEEIQAKPFSPENFQEYKTVMK